MLANFVKETASAPGTSTTFNLGGATAPFITFASVFSTGATVFYFMQDASQWECGEGTLTHGTPNTLARTTVIGNSAGNTSKLNFAGATAVYNAFPAERVIYKTASGYVPIPTGYLAVGTSTPQGIARITSRHNGTQACYASVVNTTSSLTHVIFWNNANVTPTNVGSITTSGSATAYNTSSDYRLKILHGPADAAFVGQLQVHDAEFMTNGDRYPMFVAHELQAAGAGFMVTGAKDAVDEAGRVSPQAVDNSKLIPALVAYCQALERRLAALEAAQ
ncbi:MAG: hypothetical protein AB7F35_06350 [Acetobacteraceae bacterium]